MSDALSTLRFGRDPLGVLRDECQRARGDVFTLRLAFVREAVVVTEPEVVSELVGADPERAEAGAARRAVLPQASARSVCGGDGEVHHRARSRLAAAFAPEAMAGREAAMAEIAARHVAGWPRRRPLQLLSRLRTLVDDVFVRLLLGVEDEGRASPCSSSAAGRRCDASSRPRSNRGPRAVPSAAEAT